MKMLVIDDSSTMRMILQKTLKELGHEVSSAKDGKEGLAAAQALEGVGAVFVDWNMPEMNGLEVVVAARADARLQKVPIIMVTTESELAHVQTAIAAGANGYILKPFTKESVLAKVTELGLA